MFVSTNTGRVCFPGGWCLCLDKHRYARSRRAAAPPRCGTLNSACSRSGCDVRYLVVFKDTALRTIRDLRQHHLPLLREINTRVRAWLRETQQGCFGMYFHFLPSVFQLHLHVRDKSFSRKHVRMQPLQNVMGNLAKTSMYYKDALIMTKYCKMFQKAETHRKMDINI